jgi:hypothetical protein
MIKLATIRWLGQQEGSLALNNVFAGIPQEQFSWRERETKREREIEVIGSRAIRFPLPPNVEFKKSSGASYVL